MPWFKVDDSLAFHGKTIAAGNAPMGLWVRAGAWSMQMLTDGHIPAHVVRQLGTTAEAKKLVTAGLWIVDPDGDGYRFHQWDERQPTRAKVEDQRRENTQRLADWRAKKRKKGGVRDAV